MKGRKKGRYIELTRVEHSKRKIQNEWLVHTTMQEKNPEFKGYFLVLIYYCKRSETFSQMILVEI